MTISDTWPGKKHLTITSERVWDLLVESANGDNRCVSRQLELLLEEAIAARAQDGYSGPMHIAATGRLS